MAENAKQSTESDLALLPEQEAAKVLNMSTSWLSKDRTSGRAPIVPFVRLGRAVRYRKADLMKLVGA
jgi:hypothetical protein